MQIASLCDSTELDDDETLMALWATLLPDAPPWAAVAEPQRSARLCNAILQHLQHQQHKSGDASASAPSSPTLQTPAISGLPSVQRLSSSRPAHRLLSHTSQRATVSASSNAMGRARSLHVPGARPWQPLHSILSPQPGSPAGSSDASGALSTGALLRRHRPQPRTLRGAASSRAASFSAARTRMSLRNAARDLQAVNEHAGGEAAHELRVLSQNLSTCFDRQPAQLGAAPCPAELSADEDVEHRLAAASLAPEDQAAGPAALGEQEQASARRMVIRWSPADTASGAAMLPTSAPPIARHRRSAASTGCADTGEQPVAHKSHAREPGTSASSTAAVSADQSEPEWPRSGQSAGKVLWAHALAMVQEEGSFDKALSGQQEDVQSQDQRKPEQLHASSPGSSANVSEDADRVQSSEFGSSQALGTEANAMNDGLVLTLQALVRRVLIHVRDP
jgi:hypothetical protein